MKSGQKILHWDAPLPAGVHRRHEDPTTSDNYGAINRAAAEPVGADGVRANDCNGQAYYCARLGRWIPCGGHWYDPYKNGYTKVKRRWPLRGVRDWTAKERARADWDWDFVRRCRRPNGEAPRMLDELYTRGALLGVIQIVEEKHPRYADAAFMQGVATDARRHDHPQWYMVLDSMAPRYKVAATKQAGGRIAIIAGTDGLRLPADYNAWPVKPDRIWG